MESATSRHHRRPKSDGGSHGPPNVVRVNHKKHEAWHIMFGNMTPLQIAEEINNIWLDPRYTIKIIPVNPEPPY